MKRRFVCDQLSRFGDSHGTVAHRLTEPGLSPKRLIGKRAALKHAQMQEKMLADVHGLKPIEVIERGEIDRLWNMVFQLRSSIPG